MRRIFIVLIKTATVSKRKKLNSFLNKIKRMRDAYPFYFYFFIAFLFTFWDNIKVYVVKMYFLGKTFNGDVDQKIFFMMVSWEIFIKMEEKNQKISEKSKYTGVYSVAVILRHFGIEVTEEKIVADYNLTDEVLDWKSLQNIAKANKLRTQFLCPTPDELREVAAPALVKMKNGTYAVVAVNNDEAIFLLDPNLPNPIALPRQSFLEVWSGEILTFAAKLNWQYIKRKYNLHWFLTVVSHYKRYLGEVMMAAFFLQMMGIAMPLFTQVVIDKVIGNHGMSTLTVLGVSMVVFGVFQASLSCLRTYVLNHTTNKLDAILGTRLFRHLISLPLPYYEHRRVGDTLMRVGALGSVREFLTGQALMTILDAFFSIVFVAFLFYYSVPLTLFTLVVIPLYLVQNIWALPIYKRKIEAVWRTGAANNAFMVEAVTGMQTVKALAIEPQFNSRWEKLISRYVQTTFDNMTFGLVVGSGSQFIQALSSLVIMWYGGHMVMRGEFTLGQLIAFQMIAGQALSPLTKILGMWPNVQQVALSLERIGDILNTRMEPVLLNQGKRLDEVKGAIKLENVSFRYRLDTPLVLDGINLEISPGEKVGIVGRSGSGKSTLTSIIQKLYTPEVGTVSLDSVDVSKLDYAWLRYNIGAVMQDNYLFNRSVRDNIAVANPSASMEQVIQAAKMAGAHEFILELNEGYDTKVGERGSSLSGGQRQRIAIARALFSNPPILIFDEATSALDYESERIIMNNLEEISKNRTLIIIAHRLSTVERCDKIIVVEKGRIAEVGSHTELRALGGIYENLYRQQEV